ncbi:hypothetical protein L1987_47382 [Smallanthus sonchifolius]|uniref:Uncharacterized protein n=1 Tax=Smallanthus sonchifolius TaxID=185202 RepID=A0ACB9G465_9ASTR|nr:hypothetical protein L1987_47382 [Smallanthus sonchifolius]
MESHRRSSFDLPESCRSHCLGLVSAIFQLVSDPAAVDVRWIHVHRLRIRFIRPHVISFHFEKMIEVSDWVLIYVYMMWEFQLWLRLDRLIRLIKLRGWKYNSLELQGLELLEIKQLCS